jgi:hypothetical protein
VTAATAAPRLRCDYCRGELHPPHADVEWLEDKDGAILDLRVCCHFGAGPRGPHQPGCSAWIPREGGLRCGRGAHLCDLPIPEENALTWWFDRLEVWARYRKRGLEHWIEFGRLLGGVA